MATKNIISKGGVFKKAPLPGSSSGLPPVTASDAGKVLAVDNSGVWGAQSNLFIVNVRFDNVTESYTADKTHAEIVEALYNGKNCIAKLGGVLYNFSRFSDTLGSKEIVFLALMSNIYNGQFIQIYEDESISCGDARCLPSSFYGDVLTYGENGWIGKPLPKKTFAIILTPTAQDYSGIMDAQPSEIGDAFRAGKTVIGNIMGVSIVFTQLVNNSASGLALVSSNQISGLGEAMIKIVTDNSSQTYSVTIYPLTPAT